jgi:uncharacterized protein (TIGR04255 family)
MPLNPPNVERVVLRNPPIKVAVAQLKFDSILSMSKPDFVAPFQEMVRREYPVVQKAHTLEVQILPAPGAPTETSTTWRFIDSEESWIVSLAADFISLESVAYTTFDDFSDRFDRLLRSVVEVFAPNPQTRLGLRYINELRIEGRERIEDWRGLINDALLGTLSSGVFDQDVREAVQVINCQQPDGTFALRFAVKTEEGACRQVLDFDYYNEERKPIDVPALREVLQRYNDVIYRMFRWCVQDELLQEYDPIR